MEGYRKHLIALMALLVIGLTGIAAACEDCIVIGHIEAEVNLDTPETGLWRYTLNLEWDTGYYSIGYIMLFLDVIHQNCECWELQSAITFPTPAGNSEAGPDYPEHWHVCDWTGSIVCIENPCLPHNGIYMRFDYGDCEHPGCCGGGTFVFYSDYPPADVEMPNLFFKLGSWFNACEGQLTGVFPSLPCTPTANENGAWGDIKMIYGD